VGCCWATAVMLVITTRIRRAAIWLGEEVKRSSGCGLIVNGWVWDFASRGG
jgi:hypothetical protein